MNRIIILLIGLFLFASSLLKAQETVVNDASVWLGLNIEKKFSKRLALTFSNQSRFDRNVSRYRSGYQDLGVEYRLLKYVYVQGDYKFIHRQLLDESFSYRHQLNAAVILKKNFGAWSLSFRNRWQWQFKDVYSSADGSIPQFVNRNKLTVKYDLNKRFQLYTSGELNYILQPAQDEGWDRYRTSIGLNYKITKDMDLDLYYTFQSDLNSKKETERFHIYGITYSIKI